MIFLSRIFQFGSIIVLFGTVMLSACKNDIKEVNKFASEKEKPEMTGENLILTYSDSARLKYKVFTPQYIKENKENDKYEEFPKGIRIISYDTDGKVIGTITAKYAKKFEDKMLWEARNEVVIVNAEGKKLETELLFWDMKTKMIYTDRYARLTADGKIIEGNDGFESDQNLDEPVFKNVTGIIDQP